MTTVPLFTLAGYFLAEGGLLVGHVTKDRQVEGLAGRLLGGADLDRGARAQRTAEVLDGGLDLFGAERLGGETVHARLEAVAAFFRRGVGGRGDHERVFGQLLLEHSHHGIKFKHLPNCTLGLIEMGCLIG